MTISVIMPTYNKAEYLDLTLAGYVLQDKKNYELIIINNGCSDNTENVIDKYYDKLPIKYHRLVNNIGSPRVRNKGLELAESDKIIFTDDDRIPGLSFIKGHNEIIKNKNHIVCIGNKHKIISIYKKKMKYESDVVPLILSKFPNYLNEFQYEPYYLITGDELINNFQKTIDKIYLNESDDNFAVIRSRYSNNLINFHLGFIMATTGNISFDRKNAAGIQFDGNISGWGCCDSDYFYQLMLEGYKFVFSQVPVNYHQEHPRNPTYWSELKRNLQYLCRKYDNLLMHLCARSFLYEANFTFEEANEYYLALMDNDKLASDYLRLLKDKLEKDFWGRESADHEI